MLDQEIIHNIFWGGGSMKKCDNHCDQALIKVAGGLYRVNICISDLMLWLHLGKFMNVK